MAVDLVRPGQRVGRGVRDIYEDRDGSIWFATTGGGAHRYDGYRWATYTSKDGLAHDDVRAVIQTRDGAMWFGTNGGGISRFNPSAEPIPSSAVGLRTAWTTYTEEDGLGTNSVDSESALMEARDGTLWAGLYSPGDTTNTSGGIARFDGNTWTMVDLPGEVPRPDVSAILQITGGDILVATDAGVFRFDGTRWTRYTTEDGLVGNVEFDILEARDGTIWLASGRSGVSRFDPSLSSSERGGRKWRSYTSEDGLPEYSWIYSIWQTEDGTVWASGWPGVLCRFDGERWRAYSSEDVPGTGSGSVLARGMSNGTVWFWEWGRPGARQFNPTRTRWTVFPEVKALRIFSVGDEVWLGAVDGVVRFDGRVWTKHTVEDGTIDGRVWVVVRDKESDLWIGGEHQGKSGVSRYDGNSWHIYTEVDGFVGTRILAGFVATNGDVWFGDRSAGALRYDGTRGRSPSDVPGSLAVLPGTSCDPPPAARWRWLALTSGSCRRCSGTRPFR